MLFTTFLYFLIPIVSGLDNGLALTPPMGWMTWQRFRCSTNCNVFKEDCLNEDLIIQMADDLIALGLQDAGYQYIIIDDCWAEKERSKSGELQPNKERFPNGMRYIADYLHSKGLKFGIYNDFGIFTCANYPGSEFYLKTDALTFAKWDVDYVKMDGCYGDPNQMNYGYPEFSKLLNNTEHPFVFSCSWPDYQGDSRANYSFISKFCNLWRNYVDIEDSWESVKSIIQFYGDKQQIFIPAAGPGHWNDPDMLIIGDFGLSFEQAKTQMAFWCLFSAPLIMSNDLRNVDKEMLEILLNPHAIKINQDPLGLQGARIFQDGNIEVWIKPLANHAKKIDILQRYNRPQLLDKAAVIIYNSGVSGALKPLIIKPRSLGFTRKAGYRAFYIFGNQFKDRQTTNLEILQPDSNVSFMVPPSSVIFLELQMILT